MMNSICKTTRLQIDEVFNSNQSSEFLESIIEILTPSVADGRLFVVTLEGESKAIGFVFLSTENAGDSHIGYLLGESFWGKGYATEILRCLIDFIKSEEQVIRLIAGVATDNIASIKLLQKLGFIHISREDNGTIFYEYQLSQEYTSL